MREFTIYCDGACRGNPGPGAYGVIRVCQGKEAEFSAVVENTTNNRMELLGAIVGIESLDETSKVQIVTDSQYLQKGMTQWIQGWQRRGWRTSKNKEVLNRDLWERLIAVAGKHEVEWEWVRGHNDHPYNERCDRLANQAIDDYLARDRFRGST